MEFKQQPPTLFEAILNYLRWEHPLLTRSTAQFENISSPETPLESSVSHAK